MKRKEKIISILLLALMAVTMFSPVSKTVKAETTELQVGAEYKTGDSILLSEDKWVVVDDSSFYVRKLVKAGTYEVGEIYCPEVLIGDNHPWYVDDLFDVVGEDYKADLSIGYYEPNKTDYEITVTGIRCSRGTGADESNAFFFELIYENKPAVTNYPLWVGGKQVTSKYLSNETEGWSYEGDAEKGILKLSEATITDALEDESCIYSNDKGYSLTIELSGTNSVTEKNAYSGICVYGDLKITGKGKLIVEGTNMGIDANHLDIDATEIDASGGTYGIFPDSVRISDSILTATGGSYGIMTYYEIEITDSTVTAEGSDKGIIINGMDYKLSISGKSTVKAKATDDNGKAIVADVIALKDVEIIKPGDGKIGSFTNGTLELKTIYDKEGQFARDVVIKNAGYSIVSGGDVAYTSGSGEDHSITVKRESNDQSCFEHFEKSQKGVEIDGKTLVKDTDYTAESGSTVITLKAEMLDRLSEGKHTVTINFDDGKVETSLTVKAAPAPTPDPEPEPKPVTPFPIPKTGVE